MASYGKPLRDQMVTAKHLRRPSNMLLRDYLRDDLSSCSSSGFKSFPRRQCCTTVRLDLLEKDLQAKRNRLPRPSITNRSSCSFKVASSTISALHKASRAVIYAVKLLPFPSISATPSSSFHRKNSKKRLLSKSLSRKVLSRSFWTKSIKEEGTEPQQWTSFRELLEEREKPSDQSTQSSSVVSVTLGSRSSSSGSSQKSNGNSWGSSEFTWEILRSSSDNSNIVVGIVRGENTLHKTVTKTSEDSTDGRSLEKLMDWAREEKEQLSPVSVLDCPFGDDEEIHSPLDSTCCRVEGETTVPGSKNKRMHKTRHFDHMASSLEPVDLEKRIAEFSEVEDEPISSPDETSKGEEKAWRLVNEVESSTQCMSKAEKELLFDFFNEENTEKEGQVCKVEKEWIKGESQGVNDKGWEVYVREMDKCERWTNISDEEVGMALEFEVLTSLVNELVLELTS